MTFPSSGMDVRVHGTRVGGLHRDKHGGVRFVPDDAWLAARQRPPLGLSFLQDPRPPVMRGILPAWFENLLPENGSALRAWICRKRGIRETDSAGLLAQVGGDLPGAVEVIGSLEAETSTPPESRPTTGELRFSLAGLQLKLSMLLSGERFVFPAHGETGRWIVKIPGSRFADLPQVEAATMTWAREVGLEVPRFNVFAVERLEGIDPAMLGEPVTAFAIERFDRSNAGRVHQEDLAQALNVLPTHKYGGPAHGASYDGLARLVRDAAGSAEQDRFIERVAFMVASGNDDAHLKNWSFQWGYDHRPWLSPCYDLVATGTWSRQLGVTEPTLALSLGRSRRFADLDRARVRVFVERAAATAGEARFMAALERARTAWPSVAAEAPDAMRNALSEHWRSVPILRDVGPLAM